MVAEALGVKQPPNKGWAIEWRSAAGGWLLVQSGVPHPEPPIELRSYAAALVMLDVLGRDE
jgi:hypothetical protein